MDAIVSILILIHVQILSVPFDDQPHPYHKNVLLQTQYTNHKNYCEQNQNVTFKSPTLDYPLYLLKGNDEWIAYNFNINILSDTNFGDLNFNNIINITDIIIMLEHIIDSFEILNNHPEELYLLGWMGMD